MIDRLPHELSEGVTATRDGLWIADALRYTEHLAQFFTHTQKTATWVSYIPRPYMLFVTWPDAAEGLRYRKGEPWCKALFDQLNAIECVGTERLPRKSTPALSRLAAILCNDADAFRVLHWCIYNLGGDND